MSAPTKLLIAGSGGHARVLVGILRSIGTFHIVGLLAEKPTHPTVPIFGLPILGSFADLSRFRRQGIRHAALGVGDNLKRQKLKKQLDTLGYQLPVLCHAQAFVDPTADVAAGAVICMGALVGAGARIEEGALLNSGCIVDHECVIGAFAHIAPGTALAGRVTVGAGSFIGLGSRVIDHLAIGRWSTVGAGSVVVRDIPSRATAYGVPARLRR